MSVYSLRPKFVDKVLQVGQSPWTAADARVGLLFQCTGRAGPRGPARTMASAPPRFIARTIGTGD